MFYRENGQFKTTYKEDQQIFPITQDRIGVLLLIAFAFIGVPMLADEYMLRAILIPFLILSLAALGVNHLGWLLRPDLFGFRCFHGCGRVCRLQLLCAR